MPASDDVSAATDTVVLCWQERMRAGSIYFLRHVRFRLQVLDTAGYRDELLQRSHHIRG